MDQLNGDCWSIEQLRINAKALTSSVNEQRPYSLTAVEYGVSHGVVQAFRRGYFRRERLVQPRVHALLVIGYAGFEVVGQGTASCVIRPCSLHRNESLCACPAGL
jgi:hypothetical protein